MTGLDIYNTLLNFITVYRLVLSFHYRSLSDETKFIVVSLSITFLKMSFITVPGKNKLCELCAKHVQKCATHNLHMINHVQFRANCVSKVCRIYVAYDRS